MHVTIRVAGAAAAALATLAFAAGCRPSGGTANAQASAAASKVIASAKANPALNADERTALTKLAACAQSQEGLTVVIPPLGSHQEPSVSHVRLAVAEHPVKAFEKIIHCTPAGHRNGKAAERCARQVVFANGAGKGVVSRDVQQTAAKCVAGK